MASSSGKDAMTCGEPLGHRYPAPTTLHNFTRQRNGLNAAYRSLLQQESSFGATTMDAFRIHVRGADRRRSGDGAPLPADRYASSPADGRV